MSIEQQKITLGAAGAVLVALVSFLAWAQGEHRSTEELARDAAKLAESNQQVQAALKEVLLNQAKLVEEALDDAKFNREALIRIEARMEAERETTD